MNEKLEQKLPEKETADVPRASWRRQLADALFVLMYVLVGGAVFWLAYQFSSEMEIGERVIAICATTTIGVMVAVLLISPILNTVSSLASQLLNHLLKMPLADIVSAVVGLIVGLILANLLNSVVGKIPVIGGYFSVLSLLFFAYIGMVVAYRKRKEFIALFARRGAVMRTNPAVDTNATPKVLDTNVLIDGRIADICHAGFIEGRLIVPNFVLDELRHIADLADSLKRNRGRRGLDILNRIQREMPGLVEIVEVDYPDIAEVDNKLLRLAQEMKAAVVTNDYNLGKVAQVQGVRVMNLNELAHAMRAVWLPGETLLVDVVQAGKEPNQGLAFLDDGTMIVVENGRQYIGSQVAVEVSSVLQTSAGRMIFAHPTAAE